MLSLNTIERAMKQVCKDYMKGEKKMRIVEVKLEKHTPYSHDIVEIMTLGGRRYRIMDWEIENLLDENGELEDIDREDL